MSPHCPLLHRHFLAPVWVGLQVFYTLLKDTKGSSDIIIFWSFNLLPNGKILDWSKLKAFADEKLNEVEKMKFVLEWLDNMVGKGDNVRFQHFLLFLLCFQKASFLGVVKSLDCVVNPLKHNPDLSTTLRNRIFICRRTGRA